MKHYDVENLQCKECSRAAQAGKEYCKLHDPELRKAKYVADTVRWDAQAKKGNELRALFPSSLRAWLYQKDRDTYFKLEIERLTEDDIRRIAGALSEWEKVTGLELRPKQS